MNYCMKLLASALLCVTAAGAAQAGDTFTGPLTVGPRIQLGAAKGVVDPVVYNSTGATFNASTSQPNRFIGGAANISGAGPQVDITSFDLFMVSLAAGSYTNIRARLQIWDTYTEGSTPIFSNAAGTTIAIDTGPVNVNASSVATLTFNLPAPLRLNSLTNKGFAVNFQADTGAGLVDDTNLVGALNVNDTQPVGTSAVAAGNGFYRNASGRTDFNFASTDLRSFATPTTNARAALILRGNSSVPVMLQSFDVN
jgi:hypothetical protein